MTEAGAFSSGPVPEDPIIDSEWLQATDDVNGGFLKAEKVMEARKEELGWVHDRKVYHKVPLQQCLERTGKKPIPLLWIDTNKGDDEHENYRSRLVVREVKARKKLCERLDAAELFSAMPPYEALKYLLSYGVTAQVSIRNKPLKFAVWDIKRAHFYGVAEERYIPTSQRETRKRACVHYWTRRCTAHKMPVQFGRKSGQAILAQVDMKSDCRIRPCFTTERKTDEEPAMEMTFIW